MSCDSGGRLAAESHVAEGCQVCSALSPFTMGMTQLSCFMCRLEARSVGTHAPAKASCRFSNPFAKRWWRTIKRDGGWDPEFEGIVDAELAAMDETLNRRWIEEMLGGWGLPLGE